MKRILFLIALICAMNSPLLKAMEAELSQGEITPIEDFSFDESIEELTPEEELLKAAKMQEYTKVARIVEHKRKIINYADQKGLTALHHAAKTNNHDVCLLLLKHGADITMQDSDKKTPLMLIAASPGQLFTTAESNCKIIMLYLHQKNGATKTALLCFNQMKKRSHAGAALLYRHFKTLLLPHLNYFSLKQLLNITDSAGKKAYDHLPIDILHPDTVYDALGIFEGKKVSEQTQSLEKVAGVTCLIQ